MSKITPLNGPQRGLSPLWEKLHSSSHFEKGPIQIIDDAKCGILINLFNKVGDAYLSSDR
jgi:hypothetical protein